MFSHLKHFYFLHDWRFAKIAPISNIEIVKKGAYSNFATGAILHRYVTVCACLMSNRHWGTTNVNENWMTLDDILQMLTSKGPNKLILDASGHSNMARSLNV